MPPQEMVLILFILVLCDAEMLLYLIQFVFLNIIKNMSKQFKLIFTMYFYITVKLQDEIFLLTVEIHFTQGSAASTSYGVARERRKRKKAYRKTV